jgi:UPF0716 protein FxsA
MTAHGLGSNRAVLPVGNPKPRRTLLVPAWVPSPMSVLARLALLFVGVPLLELFILIKLGQVVGLWPTIGLVVLTGFVGATLARLEGLRTLWKIRSELAQARVPTKALLDGLAVLLGGALLLTPGILTDLAGFSLLLPPTRRIFLGRVQKSLERRLKTGAIHVTHVAGFPSGAAFGWGVPRRQEPGSPDASGEILVELDDSEDT